LTDLIPIWIISQCCKEYCIHWTKSKFRKLLSKPQWINQFFNYRFAQVVETPRLGDSTF